MNTAYDVRKKYIEDPGKFRRIVWDYAMSPGEFFDIMDGKNENEKHRNGWMSKDWAIARVLEHAPYYDAIALVPIDIVQERWAKVQTKIFNRDIREGYEFILRRHALPSAR